MRRGWARYTVSRGSSGTDAYYVIGKVAAGGGEEELVAMLRGVSVQEAKEQAAGLRTVGWEERSDGAFPEPFDFGLGAADLVALSEPFFYDPRKPAGERIYASSVDRWICTCGNTPESPSGFWPCQEDGRPLAWGNILLKRWEGRLYVCGNCGRMIDGRTLDVVSWPSDPRTGKEEGGGGQEERAPSVHGPDAGSV